MYDAVGNRVEERFTRATTQTTLYTYYLNSNRLLSNGKYAFVYDANGNLTKKGNTYTIGAGQQVTFTTSGEGVEYWEYGYDLRNQLVQVTKNGQVVGSYSYDGEGLRVAGTSAGISRHYIFDPAGRVIYETRAGGGSGGSSTNPTTGGSSTNPTTPPDTSYVFAFGQHLAKVAGTIGDGGEVSYYHNDQLGSPMALTDNTGKVIWSQDYLPYGEDLNENVQGGDTRFKFDGKEQDEATGLYYFNARWYDPDLGRFVTEDSYAGDPNDPQTLNLYAYVLGNPLKYVDPTGNVSATIDSGPIGGEELNIYTDEDNNLTIESKTSSGGKEVTKLVTSEVGGETVSTIQTVNYNNDGGIDSVTFENDGLEVTFKNGKLDVKIGKLEGLTGVNPTPKEVEDYIRQKAREMQIPVEIALATAKQESMLKQFDSQGQPLRNPGTPDWGLMQINEGTANLLLNSFDINRLKWDWKYNVDCGMKVLKESYNAARKIYKDPDSIARGTYGYYNGGPDAIRRWETEIDDRDIGFWNYYK
ncbi:MAG: RHS domain-containing protein [Firmicutes bacterium]|nr:RHS domain-containing protein [Bacillota bacterium]